MDLVTTTGIKGKVFSPRRPNSYWMQSFCVIMLMLISGHSNLLKILKSRQSKKMATTLVGLFWCLIQPAGSSSLIIHLLTGPPSSFRTPPHQSSPPPPSRPGSWPRQSSPCQHVWKKIGFKIAEKCYCTEQSTKYTIARRALGWASRHPSSWMLTTFITHLVFVFVFECVSVGNVTSSHYSDQFSESSKTSKTRSSKDE